MDWLQDYIYETKLLSTFCVWLVVTICYYQTFVESWWTFTGQLYEILSVLMELLTTWTFRHFFVAIIESNFNWQIHWIFTSKKELLNGNIDWIYLNFCHFPAFPLSVFCSAFWGGPEKDILGLASRQSISLRPIQEETKQSFRHFTNLR